MHHHVRVFYGVAGLKVSNASSLLNLLRQGVSVFSGGGLGLVVRMIRHQLIHIIDYVFWSRQQRVTRFAVDRRIRHWSV